MQKYSQPYLLNVIDISKLQINQKNNIQTIAQKIKIQSYQNFGTKTIKQIQEIIHKLIHGIDTQDVVKNQEKMQEKQNAYIINDNNRLTMNKQDKIEDQRNIQGQQQIYVSNNQNNLNLKNNQQIQMDIQNQSIYNNQQIYQNKIIQHHIQQVTNINTSNPILLHTPKANRYTPNNQFQSKSLFKSFNTSGLNIVGNPENQHGNQGMFANLNTNNQRKVNVFTKSNPNNNNSSFNSNNGINNNGNVQHIRKNSTGFLTIPQNIPMSTMPKQYNTQPNISLDFPSFTKKNTKQFKQSSQPYQIRSKRKVKPTVSNPDLTLPKLTVEEKLTNLQTNTLDCHSLLQKKLSKKSSTQNSNKQNYYVNQKNQFLYNEYFYGNYDKIYFQQENQALNKLYKELRIDPKKLTFKEHKLLRKLLPRPKLFNVDFIISQQIKLNQFRTHLRQIPKDKSKNQQIQLTVGRQVTALHPVCGHLHSGTILAIYKQNQYMVKFTRPQLGTQKVLDINISSRSLLNPNNKAAVQNIDYQSMGIVIKLLEYKGDLIERFKEYNCIIQDLIKQGKQVQNNLLQQYGWLGSTINILSMGLRHIIAKFRIRGVGQNLLKLKDQQLVGKNFSSLLINPLNLMSKQLQNSSQMSDVQTSRQIKQLAELRSRSRIQLLLSSLSAKFSHHINENQLLNPEQKQNMGTLVQNFIGILLNLRYEGKNFNLQSNKYINNIIQLIDREYPEYFNQIYSNLHSIMKKINSQDNRDD